MRKYYKIHMEDFGLFKKQIIHYASFQRISCIIDTNEFPSYINIGKELPSYNFLAALDPVEEFQMHDCLNPFEKLWNNWNKNKDWVFGHFTYDLKNKIENLNSEHPDHIGFEEMFFFIPGIIIENNQTEFLISYTDKYLEKDIELFIQKIRNIDIPFADINEITINNRTSKENFIADINNIKQHIQKGDIYEVNYCQEFYKENIEIDLASTFIRLCEISPAPFSCFYKINEKVLLSASPERYLKKSGSTIISQPMKGTAKKSIDKEENSIRLSQLLNSIKERSENIMIVDLVRNDLSKTALADSVNVAELCKVYEFPQVYQMISTITSEIDTHANFIETIKTSFPMGSMTGAPKIRAMEIIEQYEKFKRGLFSGSVGYIDPSGDFDFNVIIRSIQYNISNKYLSFCTGSAITILSDAENEYEECLIKAEGILMCLNATLSENV